MLLHQNNEQDAFVPTRAEPREPQSFKSTPAFQVNTATRQKEGGSMHQSSYSSCHWSQDSTLTEGERAGGGCSFGGLALPRSEAFADVECLETPRMEDSTSIYPPKMYQDSRPPYLPESLGGTIVNYCISHAKLRNNRVPEHACLCVCMHACASSRVLIVLIHTLVPMVQPVRR